MPAHLKSHPAGSGKLGAMGIRLGGHLAFRAGMNPDVGAPPAFTRPDIHDHQHGRANNDDSPNRAAETEGELLMIWRRQDRISRLPDAGSSGDSGGARRQLALA
jgi:carboxymethylenebutenolidase